MAVVGNERSVVVTGDVTVDWNLARPGASRAREWTGKARTSASHQPGGAALLGELLEAVAGQLPGVEIHRPAIASGGVSPADGRFHHSYALWARLPREASGGKETVWRLEEYLGLDRAQDEEDLGLSGGLVSSPDRADVVVVDDTALGFRDRRERWPGSLLGAGEVPSWILLKMASPVATGLLWEELQSLADRLIVVMTIDDLRLTEVQISRNLSWERTAQDLMWELLHNPVVNALARCAHIVVSFDTAGAMLLSPQTGRGEERIEVRCSLFFDPPVIGDEWVARHPGGMIGSTSCLTAGIARQLIAKPVAPDIGHGIQRGLEAMRALHLQGYMEKDAGSPRPQLVFPTAAVASELGEPDAPFEVASVQDPVRSRTPNDLGRASDPRPWTILEDRYPGGLGPLAERILVEGPETVLSGVPLGQFGRLLTVDRQEIEGFRSVASLIREYSRQDRPNRPLSMGVFGPPGSGKSFGVVEVAASLLPGRISVLQFNLSQWDDPSQLHDALHQVRDVGLTGRLPLVFWDEFDTAHDGSYLGWLRHFLTPMQDGAFTQGQIVHPVGPAVFVFAGGTSERMELFAAGGDAFITAKGPDFVSRLKGYVNILGPNPRDDDVGVDPYHLIRRAILLRSILLRATPQLFRWEADRTILEIDPGLVQAFLQTSRYRHGARSMESIVAMSLLSGRTRFERSCLPAEPQLDLHVNAADFLALVHRPALHGELLERLAEAAHVVYCAGLLESGFDWSEPVDEYLFRYELLAPFAGRAGGKTHPSLVSYQRLPEELKDQNRELVRDIPRKLAAAGYAMRPARTGDPPARFTDEEEESLSEWEHERWLKSKLEAGWSYGQVTDAVARSHEAMLPWRKLSEEDLAERYGAEQAARLHREPLPEAQKEKDRDLVRGIPRILRVAGFTMAETRPRPGPP